MKKIMAFIVLFSVSVSVSVSVVLNALRLSRTELRKIILNWVEKLLITQEAMNPTPI